MKSHEVIKNLKANGCKVSISHHRLYNIGGGYDCFTKREYENTVLQYKTWMYMYHTGGFTKVTVEVNGNIFTSKFNFGSKRFNKRIGVQAALGRVLKQMN